MPGTISGKTLINEVFGGAADGLSLETAIPWDIICGLNCPPQSIRFHISSSNGTNLPNNIIDNMDGPGGVGGGAIVILDLGVTKIASATTVTGGSAAPTFDYTITVSNNGGGDATGVEVESTARSPLDGTPLTAARPSSSRCIPAALNAISAPRPYPTRNVLPNRARRDSHACPSITMSRTYSGDASGFRSGAIAT